jgi:FKBP-type peptidyl-prolyl cis-trans isomerase SlyD
MCRTIRRQSDGMVLFRGALKLDALREALMSDKDEADSGTAAEQATAAELNTPEPVISSPITINKVVSFHYRLSDVDADGNRGKLMEESFGGEPLYYLHGFHNVIVGLERALEGRCEGDAIDIVLPADEAYGRRQADAVRRVPIKHLHVPQGKKTLLPGMIAAVQTKAGTKRVLLIKVGKFNADVDFNHPYAGKTLHYEVKVVGVRDGSAEEIAHGHVHGPGGHHR